MDDKQFIQSILNKIGEFGNGELEFETRDVERLCHLAEISIKNCNIPHVSDTVCPCKIARCNYQTVRFGGLPNLCSDPKR